ncbi:Abi family protein [Arthrobacter sp. ERGS1:01]|uniref:Abi family protein n=1 Tax=Arthrobacter sp. ERGS1:01 TaxID=1704044 RepID=UPI0006B57647|nr:Abi family protein [Arthrobacter sp. ERGS1:01]
MTEYDRPHLSFAEQAEVLESRGLDCSGCDAPAALSRIGYYRLSAYTYPFRKTLEPGDDGETPYQYRQPDFELGYKLTDALKLYEFDGSLRLLCMEALKTIEIGLRVHVAYVLGRRDRFGHLKIESLDQDACGRLLPEGNTAFDAWTARYDSLKRQANSEDFVRHYTLKYDGVLPIWVAVEVLDFGGVIRLYSLLNKADQNEVASYLGVKNAQSLRTWLLSLGVVRNTSAHHSRLWNRSLTYNIGSFNPSIVEPELRHLRATLPNNKIYAPLAIMAYIITRIDPTTNWPRALKTKVSQKFPGLEAITPENAMGFPSGWRDLDLWNYSPQKPGIK